MAAEPGGRDHGPAAGLAKPLHLQFLEKGLRLEPFLAQASAVFNQPSSPSDTGSSSGSSSSSEDEPGLVREWPWELVLHPQESTLACSDGKGLVKEHVMTHSKAGHSSGANGYLSAELKVEKAQLYNFNKLKKNRKWMKSILLSEPSDSENDTDTSLFGNDELQEMLRLHKFRKLHQNKYRGHKEQLQQYQFYSVGLLSSQDHYREAHRHGMGSRAKRLKDERKLKAKLKRQKRRRREDQLRASPALSDSRFVARFSQEFAGSGRKRHLTTEQLDARRKRFWLSIIKKDIPKAVKQKSSAHNNILTNAKKLAHQCVREVRRSALQAQKNCKETIPRARRLTREMLLYWKRYEKVEREHRRRAEKEALEQRKLDEEMREAKRQQRKLNFLITQTELYAHFMSRKAVYDGHTSQSDILSQLEDESLTQHLPLGGSIVANLARDDYDSGFYKAQALKNAHAAFETHQNKTLQFDQEVIESRQVAGIKTEQLDTGFGESYSLANPSIRAGEDIPQPASFCGKLKAYQLKGMNWLANLYEQGINGILADEMGLGKTVQSIALLAHLAERENIWGPFLIISPASTLNNWHQEFTRFVPGFKVLPYWGNPHDRKVIRKFWSQKTLFTLDAPFHVVITSYQLVVQDVRYFQRIKWQYMILDEAQALKSSNSVRWKILLQFHCRNRLLLTGTPIQNTMAELWALLHFIMPTLFDSHEEFNEWFSRDIESHAENKSIIDENQLSRLHMILKPFMLRRIKKEVENELSDKIEVLMYCHLNSRQRLLYQGLKNKISIEDLLQSSMGSSQQAHTTTSSLMNLVMQFRKVCNHPDLFERQETRSPFHFCLDYFRLPKMVYREATPTSICFFKQKLLHFTFSPFSPENIHHSLFHNKGSKCWSTFSFSRFVDMSPAELQRLVQQGSLYRWLCIVQAARATLLLQHQHTWHDDKVDNRLGHRSLFFVQDLSSVSQRHFLTPTMRALVFVEPSEAICCHADHVIFNLSSSQTQVSPSCLARSTSVFPGSHIVTRRCLPSSFSPFLYTYIPRATGPFPQCFCSDRSAEIERLQLERCGPVNHKQLLLFGSEKGHQGGVTALRPHHGWSYIRIPDKESLITDSGKLSALDSLLARLKAESHRVLIYSQMTRMIDLLEEYMVHRNHTYIRLDGSSKISERRDMVADFQSRSDIFVFLLSTRAGGLGINLTAADTVIFFDSDWNPTVDQQAMDRAHRLGQTKQVTVYRIICKGTIEERILQRAKEKSEIQKMVISGSNFKPDALKPKEVVSLLLDDEELEKKLRQRQEEKKQLDVSSKTKDRRRKREGATERGQAEGECKRARWEVAAASLSAPPSLPSADNSNTSAEWDESLVSVDSAQPSPYSEISLCSELQGGSIPPDESSNEMLLVVDEPRDSTPPAVPLDPQAAVEPQQGNASKARPFVRNRGRAKASEKARGRKSAGAAAAMAGAMAGAAAASAAAYAAYGYNITQRSPQQASMVSTAAFTTFGAPTLTFNSPLAPAGSRVRQRTSPCGQRGPKASSLTSRKISKTPASPR
uniref:chromatin-remodeling ATPase INO80 isoform X2 n=1 Tax=Myxine glutinosa TaxID=7769 RepID=UPI00358F80CD